MTYPAMPLTDTEWRYIVQLLATEYDCNENPNALAVLQKITGVSSDGSDKTITSAVRFFAADEQIREGAQATPLGKRMADYEFEPWHTGGGIYVWGRSLNGYDLYITAGTDGELGTSITEPFGLGVYDADMQEVAFAEANNLAGVLTFVDQFADDAVAFIKNHPYNTETI